MGKVIDNQDVPTDTQALTFDSASGEWKAEDGGGSGISRIMFNGNLFDSQGLATEFFAFGTQVAISGTEAVHQTPVPIAFTAKTYTVFQRSNTFDGDVKHIIRKNAVDTALEVLLLAGVPGAYFADVDVSFAKLDLIDVQIINVDATLGDGSISGETCLAEVP